MPKEIDGVDKRYLETIKQISDFIYDEDVEHLITVRASILEALHELGVGIDDIITRSSEINIHYPREYSLLYRITSAFSIYAYLRSHGYKSVHIRHQLVSELCMAYDVCIELIENYYDQ